MSHSEQSSDKLCVDCKQFYGNPAKQNLCSACSKKQKNDSVNDMAVQSQSQSGIVPSKQVKDLKIEEGSPPKEHSDNLQENQEKCKQEDHKFCWICKKKVNLLGIRCKCDFTFCNKHRMPENHSCEFDHASFDRELIKYNNPLVKKLKLSKI